MTEQEIPAGEFPEDAGSHIADEDKDETPDEVEHPGTGVPMEGLEVPLGETGELVVDDPSLPSAPDIAEGDAA